MHIALRWPALWLLVAVAYVLFAKLGLLAAFEQANTSPIWPPTGIAIAACLLKGNRIALGIFVGALWTTFNASNGALWPSICIAAGNTAEAVLASIIIKHYAHSYPFNKVRDVFVFCIASTFACAVGATNGTLTLVMGGLASAEHWPSLWLTWWTGDLVGALVCTPIITFHQHIKNLGKPQSNLHLFTLTLLLFGVTYILFNNWIFGSQKMYPLLFLLLPFLLLFSLRFHQRGTSIYIVVISLVSIYVTFNGQGPFAIADPTSSLILLQSFIATICVASLTLAASDIERSLAIASTKNANNELENRVSQRTLALKKSNEKLTEELTQRQNLTNALENLLETTKLHTTKEFLSTIVRNLADTYKVNYAFIGTYEDETKTSIKTLSVWANGKPAENFTYSLYGTPCANALDHKLETTHCDVQAKYPEDQLLVDMNIHSYMGAALVDENNQSTGIVVIMDTHPLQMWPWMQPLFGIFANRVATELLRKITEDELKLAASVFAESVEAILITDSNANILRANPAFSRITGFKKEDVIGKQPSLWSSGKHDPGFFKELWLKLISTGEWQGEITNRKFNGEIYTSWQTISAVRDADGHIYQYISIFSDVSERKISEEKIYTLAHFDEITGLPNRNAFTTQLKHSLDSASRHGQEFALLFLDVDNFKLINDSLGHSYGDKLLKAFAQRLQSTLRKEDYLARLGGDEFTVIISNITSVNTVSHVAIKILEELKDPITIGETEVNITASIGICLYPVDGNNTNELLKNSDTAMYQAKDNGKNCFHFYTKEMHQLASHRLNMEQSIRRGLKNNEFDIHYQPQVNVTTGNIIGLEALIRWPQTDGSYIPPNEFIAIAEECGLILPLGDWVLEQALIQQKLWLEAHKFPVRIAINISARQLIGQDMFKVLQEKVERLNIDPNHVELELTESILMGDVDNIISTLKELRDFGIHLSIDDFGTGYSSMAYLKRFPINKLKIDQSFIRDLADNADDRAIATAIISLARALNMDVIAEGVETKEQLDYLIEKGCHEAQGYYFSKPSASGVINSLLSEGGKILK